MTWIEPETLHTLRCDEIAAYKCCTLSEAAIDDLGRFQGTLIREAMYADDGLKWQTVAEVLLAFTPY